MTIENLGMEGGEAGVRPGSGQRQQQQRDGLQKEAVGDLVLFLLFCFSFVCFSFLLFSFVCLFFFCLFVISRSWLPNNKELLVRSFIDMRFY